MQGLKIQNEPVVHRTPSQYRRRLFSLNSLVSVKLDMEVNSLEQSMRAHAFFEPKAREFASTVRDAAEFAMKTYGLRKKWQVAFTTFPSGGLGVTLPELEAIELDPTQRNTIYDYDPRKSLAMTTFHEFTHAFQIESGRLSSRSEADNVVHWEGRKYEVEIMDETKGFDQFMRYRSQPWEKEADEGATFLFERFVKEKRREP